MKRNWFALLVLALALALALPTALATGDPNLDGGGGGMGDALDAQNKWSPGDDGVRVTVVTQNGGLVAGPIDLSNRAQAVEGCFIKRSKLQYLTGASLSHSYGYTNWEMPEDLSLPTIIQSGGGSNILAIKSYFTDERVIAYIAGKVGMELSTLTGGEYKLLLEPIAYFTYQGVRYAMTATEAAMFDAEYAGGDLRYQLGRCTHQNLPLSMYLEQSDFGIYPWTGGLTGKQSNADIITYLGVGVVSFDGTADSEPPEVTAQDYTFRTDTDVIVSVYFQNTGAEITPDDNAYLTFQMGETGYTYQKQFVCPEGGAQYVWVKWHTPSTPQTVTITVTSSAIPSLHQTLTAEVVELTEQTPPDPTYYDTSPGFTLAKTPDYGSCTSASWWEWYAYWHEYWVWHPDWYWVDTSYTDDDGNEVEDGYWRDDGWYQDDGWWVFETLDYTARLTVDHTLSPAERCQTHYIMANGETTMKSGYGVEVSVLTNVTSNSVTNQYDVIPIQNAAATFPEFGFQTYDRLLTTEDRFRSRRTFTFQSNPCSYYGDPVHFTPLWYPDDVAYVVPVVVFDAWTPAGQLYATVTDEILIYGSVLDDWYIHLEE